MIVYYKINNDNYYKITDSFILHLDRENNCINSMPLEPFKAVRKMYDLIKINESEFTYVLKEIILELGIWEYTKSKD